MVHMVSVGVVLGAGGSPGSAFHAGVLATLADETGFDARDAELIVGTSAGANTAVTLRAGLSPADHLARLQGAPLSPDGEALARLVVTPHERVDDSRDGISMPSSARLVLAGVLRRDMRPGLVLAGVLPRGDNDGASLAERAREMHPAPWPGATTWIVAVRLDTGKRIVFGRDDVALPHIGEAVQASSAVPGLYEPVTIDDVSYIDGGVHSPTNVDLTAGLGFDVVVVSSPMSIVADDASLVSGSPSRWWHNRLTRRESAAMSIGATKGLVVEPDADAVAAIEEGDGATIAAEAARRTREVLDDPANNRARRRLSS